MMVAWVRVSHSVILSRGMANGKLPSRHCFFISRLKGFYAVVPTSFAREAKSVSVPLVCFLNSQRQGHVQTGRYGGSAEPMLYEPRNFKNLDSVYNGLETLTKCNGHNAESRTTARR